MRLSMRRKAVSKVSDKLEEFCIMTFPAKVIIDGIEVNCPKQRCLDCPIFEKCIFLGKEAERLFSIAWDYGDKEAPDA